MTAVNMKTINATQFCASAIVQVRNGGRKKKLKHATAPTAAAVASAIPERVGGPDAQACSATAAAECRGSDADSAGVCTAAHPIATGLRSSFSTVHVGDILMAG
jgi:hypothetical protein